MNGGLLGPRLTLGHQHQRLKGAWLPGPRLSSIIHEGPCFNLEWYAKVRRRGGADLKNLRLTIVCQSRANSIINTS